MINRHGRNFKRKRALRKRIAKRIISWNSIIKSASDRKIKELCIGFRNYWERKLSKLG